MHVTVDDVNFCDDLKCLHVLLIACDMAFLCNDSGLSILLHGVISLPDATSCDK